LVALSQQFTSPLKLPFPKRLPPFSPIHVYLSSYMLDHSVASLVSEELGKYKLANGAKLPTNKPWMTTWWKTVSYFCFGALLGVVVCT
jgi:hypothetical protein